ncbi:hypothetical protein [Nocardioides donggukensis]|uniref:Sulfotransferase family protein n=1 Tax=Nocardioides donggukensis TaxID=2774019 RepID=A0A927Q254_9ACTN|nr:hypothetical protein [Nocardioides donggukensis]MBD8869356.1 hypothetical protein [Nocardioides donggukensis]
MSPPVDAPEAMLPAGSLLLHVGPPKTGSTTLQAAFDRNRQALAERGVVYAGEGERPRMAVRELVGRDRHTRIATGAWDGLVAEVRAAGEATVVVSNETLAFAKRPAAERAVRELGGERAHVVMVVRPIARLLPSQWQQRVRNQPTMPPYEEWLRAVLSDDPEDRHHRHFWRVHDLGRQVRRWSRAAAPDRVVAVVSDEGDRAFLPRTFEALLGLPSGLLAAPKAVHNVSLRHGGAELVRALYHSVRERGWDEGMLPDELKERIVRGIATSPAGARDVPIRLPAWAADRVAELDAQRAEVLASSDVRVIGDPGSLRDRPEHGSAEEAAAPTTVPIELAVEALAAAIARDPRADGSP